MDQNIGAGITGYEEQRAGNTLGTQSTTLHCTAEHQLDWDATHWLLDLLSALGEVAKEMLLETAYGTQPLSESLTWREELGDTLFSLITLANRTREQSGRGVTRGPRKISEAHRRGGAARTSGRIRACSRSV